MKVERKIGQQQVEKGRQWNERDEGFENRGGLNKSEDMKETKGMI